MGGELHIVGSGPAGAAAAYVAGREGLRPIVYEANPRPAVKPCGRGVPSLQDLEVPIPKESILINIKGAVLYVNGKKSVEIREGLKGYVVDKELMIRALVESYGGVLITSAPARRCCGRWTVRTSSGPMELREGLLAGGVAYYSGERINAVQAIARSKELEIMDYLYIDFDTRLLGYYWIFPYPEGAEVGVGGFADMQTLLGLLRSFAKNNELLRGAELSAPSGAQIAVGGLDLGYVDGLLKVGEAAGFVLPLTGEGIRPSMISGAEAAKAITNGEDPLSRLRNLRISRAISAQRSIVEATKRMSPEQRAEFLSAMPAAVHEEVALGTMRLSRIVASLASRPDLLAKLLKYVAAVSFT